MPGIVGFSAPLAADRNSLKILSGMQELITHFSTYRPARLFSDNQVSATHTDKEVIQRGPQPFEHSGVFAWFDGELFKTSRLTFSLGKTTPCTPTELLCRLFVDDPSFSFLKRIDGIYSCAMYDSTDRKVHLVSDRYGLRYLYWTIHNGSLAWASELKAMLALPGFQPTIDRSAVHEFMIDGYLWGNRSWFEGVQLVAPGTVLTWDIEQRSLSEQKYWDWDNIRPIGGKIDEKEVADELGRLFVDAVRSRCLSGERVGVLLSGGLDSRAILAAMPVYERPVVALTFGKADCIDCQIAARAAKVKGALFHSLEINERNFMDGRLSGVWWNDGQPSLLDMHVSAILSQKQLLFDIVLDGFLGGTLFGGSYLKPFGKTERWKIDNRGRRFIVNGPRFYGAWLEYRLPFVDNDLIDLLFSLPREMRAKHHIYKMMLLRTFPEFYGEIPWFTTLAPIKYPLMGAQSNLLKHRWMVTWSFDAVRRRLLKSKLKQANFTDYPEWIRSEPARTFFESVLTSPSALYPEFVSREKIVRMWKRHLAGEDHAKKLFLHVTFETWLNQVFRGCYRPRVDGAVEKAPEMLEV